MACDDLLTTREAADLLGVTTNALYILRCRSSDSVNRPPTVTAPDGSKGYSRHALLDWADTYRPGWREAPQLVHSFIADYLQPAPGQSMQFRDAFKVFRALSPLHASVSRDLFFSTLERRGLPLQKIDPGKRSHWVIVGYTLSPNADYSNAEPITREGRKFLALYREHGFARASRRMRLQIQDVKRLEREDPVFRWWMKALYNAGLKQRVARMEASGEPVPKNLRERANGTYRPDRRTVKKYRDMAGLVASFEPLNSYEARAVFALADDLPNLLEK